MKQETGCERAAGKEVLSKTQSTEEQFLQLLYCSLQFLEGFETETSTIKAFFYYFA